jgi:hypothetical protein
MRATLGCLCALLSACGGGGGEEAASPDAGTQNGGTSFTSESIGAGAPLRHLHLGSGFFIAAGGAPAQVFRRSSFSESDTWKSPTLPALPAGSVLHGGANGGSNIGYGDILVGSDGSKALVLVGSSNAQTFALKPSAGAATTNTLRAVAGSGPYVAVGDGGTLLRSDDATTWTRVPLTTSANLTAVASIDRFFVAAGENGTIVIGYGGATSWTVLTAGTATFRTIAQSGDRILLGGDGGALYASDPF